MISLRVRYTKQATADPSIMLGLRRPMVLAEALARRLYDRVVNRGDLATAVSAYAEARTKEKRVEQHNARALRWDNRSAVLQARGDLKGAAAAARTRDRFDDAAQGAEDSITPYVISDEYATLVGVSGTKWRSSAAFHKAAGTKPGSFRVSGGMWSGLGVRNVGGAAAVIDFAGSSLGASQQSAKTKGGRERKSRSAQVRNQIKAGTVFRNSGVNPIQPKEAEEEALVAAVCKWAQQMLVRTLGATAGDFNTTGDRALLQDVLRLYDGSK